MCNIFAGQHKNCLSEIFVYNVKQIRKFRRKLKKKNLLTRHLRRRQAAALSAHQICALKRTKK